MEKGMCARTIVVLTIGLSFFFTNLHGDEQESTQLLERYVHEGRSFYSEHYYLGAVEMWGLALRIDPGNVEIQRFIEDALYRYEELTGYLEEGFRLIEENRPGDAYEQLLYVQNNSSPKNEDLSSLVTMGLEYAEGWIALQEKQAELIREAARELFIQDRLEESRLKWQEVLELLPGDKEALLFLSKITFKEQEWEKFVSAALGYFENGVRLYGEGRFEDALDQFENAIAMNYRKEESRRYIEEIHDVISERESLRQERNTDLVGLYLREGIKYYNLNRYRESLSQLNRGLKLDPGNTQIKEYMVRVAIALKREEEKVVPPNSHFFKLIENLKMLGSQAYRKGNYQESIRYWEEILLIFPFNEKARINLTKVLGKTDPGLSKEIISGMYDDAVSLIRQGERRKAEAKLKLILQVTPDYRDTQVLLQQTAEPQENVNLSDKVRRESERYYRKGIGYYQNEQLKEAIEMWRKALELNPDMVDVRIDLSKAEMKLRNLQKAASGTDDPYSEGNETLRIKVKKHYLEGVTLFMNGLYGEAISEWEEVLKLDPSHDNARINIEKAHKRLEGAQGSS
jgi:tetratricopeptide (TPR) repeat protein